MSPPNEVDLDPQEKAILREWRELLVEHYTQDIKRLKGNPALVHGFEVEHALIDGSDTLRREFHLSPTRTLRLGARVLQEQFEQHTVRMRPVIRVVGLSPNYLRKVDDLRMRDRNQVVCVDVHISDVSPPYGWLCLAVYECIDCSHQVHLFQRRGRERESPTFCEPCLDRMIERMGDGDAPYPPFPRRGRFKMLVEECKYEDVQDIRMNQVVYNEENFVLNTSSKHALIGTMADDLVGEVGPVKYARVNGIVRVQPVPDRNFAKDTRRILSLDVLSVEPLALKE